MSEVRRVGPDDWELFREIRLRALADSPDAFGSTLEREQGFGEADWRQRLAGPVYVVTDPDPVAVGGLFDGHGEHHVWGMWTEPGHRGRGHARRILDALIAPDVTAELHVNTTNRGARRVYERYGFVGTGDLEPLRAGSAQQMERMVRRP
ncbi:GNAT family N-acetyltransferase [Nocardioides cynanchi]|uniref:GNAT family N-acetyltransferase n=1 Tax=Nocardioides cynanchi TaxID=2558918 RepID=UPI0012457EA9|nr:GNAT family N-acetyltransferase [Nocardioides cynanchi]